MRFKIKKKVTIIIVSVVVILAIAAGVLVTLLSDKKPPALHTITDKTDSGIKNGYTVEYILSQTNKKSDGLDYPVDGSSVTIQITINDNWKIKKNSDFEIKIYFLKYFDLNEESEISKSATNYLETRIADEKLKNDGRTESEIETAIENEMKQMDEYKVLFPIDITIESPHEKHFNITIEKIEGDLGFKVMKLEEIPE